MVDKWKVWIKNLPIITSYSIPRHMIQNDCQILFTSLHGFADASSKAYGVAIYYRLVHGDGSTTISLVTAKSRVLPVKPLTIPKSELVAAYLLAKLLG